MMEIYTVKEVAKILGIGTRSVYNYIRAGDMQAVVVGRQYRISQAHLEDFMKHGADRRNSQRKYKFQMNIVRAQENRSKESESDSE